MTAPRKPPELVAIGASAGGFDALMLLLGGLPPGWPLPVVAVLHLPGDHTGSLADVFRPRLQVPVREAQAHAPIAPGCVHFATAGYHLLVEADRSFSLSCDPPVLFSRPSIDVLFESAADALGPALAAVLLTGANEDGGAGLCRVQAAGGVTVVQDPAEAAFAAMPQAALARCQPDHVRDLAGIAALLREWGEAR